MYAYHEHVVNAASGLTLCYVYIILGTMSISKNHPFCDHYFHVQIKHKIYMIDISVMFRSNKIYMVLSP